MAVIQKEFMDYHEQIKLGTYDENQTLRDKRDTLIDVLRKSLCDEKIPNTDKKLTFSKIDQGSYSMHTGVKPLDDDYDIDVGVIFDISTDDYDSKALKKLVRDKLDKQYNRAVEYNRPCVTVNYNAGYHVDLPVYAKNGGDLHIAWGKENSTEHIWYESDPEGLKQWVNDVSNDIEQRAQFRRCVRYLKRWKNNKFTSNGNTAPPSIGFTIQARTSFVYKKEDDLSCLIGIARGISDSFTSSFSVDDMKFYKVVDVPLPVAPGKNVYYKMTKKQLDNYYNKVDELVEALEAAQGEESLSESSKILNKVFGDFPVISDAIKSNKQPYLPTGMSA
ncbi:cyclic GMP-AMP synthase DncV-like nucleotidyltransferase [uncultured Shewanella sp.]|uniref:cyclic GMP-AMP synthase DncV-like nucleotidyltransferase n=1 Tax=uncultured Shewanella sp. TaxID=173975 RepID=UPI0037041994